MLEKEEKRAELCFARCVVVVVVGLVGFLICWLIEHVSILDLGSILFFVFNLQLELFSGRW